uniref:Uncharacterized protein n=1 Tax=Triticum urartu TaxID=4572 RepID=A0A8R7PGY0_TRIUA
TLGLERTAARPPVETRLPCIATAGRASHTCSPRPPYPSYSRTPRASAMSLAAAASPSCRFLSPSTAARRRFLHHLLAAPPRPPQLRRCSPYHWMAVRSSTRDALPFSFPFFVCCTAILHNCLTIAAANWMIN